MMDSQKPNSESGNPPNTETDEKTDGTPPKSHTRHLADMIPDIFDTIDIAMAQLDLNYRVVRFNQKALEIYGENALGDFCYHMAAKRDTICDNCPAQEVYDGKTSGRSEHKRTTPSGQEIYIDHIATPIRDSQGNITGSLILIIDITERKHQEKELLAHRDHLEKLVEQRTRDLMKRESALKRSLMEREAIIDALPGMVTVVDREFNTIVANSAVVEKFGNTDKTEVLGRKCHQVRKGLDHVCPQCAILRAFETGKPVSRTSTQEEETLMGIAAKSYAIPLKEDSGTIWGGVEVIMDITDLKQKEQTLRANQERLRQEITERKRIDKALQESEERLVLALSGANEIVWDWHMDDGSMHFDTHYFTMAGYEPYEFPATFHEWKKRVHPDDIRKIKRSISRHLSGDLENFDVEFRFLRKGGDYMWIHGKGKIVDRNDQGDPTRFIGTHADITVRKQIEESFRITQFSFDRAAVGIYRIGSDARILDVNDKAAQILGYTKEELTAMSIFDIDPLVNNENWGGIWQTLCNHGLDSFESLHRRKDGGDIPVEIHSNLLEYNGQQFSIAFVQDISERKQAEDALREKEQLLSNVFDSMHEGVFVLDRAFKYTHWNRSLEQTSHTPREEVLGTIPWEKFPFLRNGIENTIKKAMRGEGTLNVELHYDRPDGTMGWTRESYVPLLDLEDHITGVVGVIEDITEIKLAEQARDAAYTIINSSPLVAFVWRNEEGWPVEFVSDNIESILGYHPHELLSGNIKYDQMVHPDDLDRVGQEVATYSAEAHREEFVHEPYRVLTKEGQVRWVDDRTYIRRDTVGTITHYQGIILDITVRKHAEDELNKAQSLITNIINSMPSVLVGIDTHGKITQWNKTVEQATGIAAHTAQGKSLSDLMPWMASEMNKIADSIRTRQIRQEQKRPRPSANGTCYEDLTIYPLITNGVEGAVIRIDDVTEKVRMEEMMIQSEKMLSVGGLAAGMAHEINNPLAGMMQTANVMTDRLTNLVLPANRKAAETAGTTMESIEQFMQARDIPRMITTINESGRRVATVVDNMLSFARKSDTTFSSHPLEKLLDKTLELAATDYDLKKHYDFKQIDIIKKYADNLPPVPCEGAKIQQVLLNILRNGAQAMQEAGVEFPCFFVQTRLESEQNMAVIEIEDNGPGMDETTRKRVFEPFFTTKTMDASIGLGLSVSYFIITENHRGKMTVESKPGAGAKFIIHLPMKGA
jgi:PAS domain S-box-containing protein